MPWASTMIPWLSSRFLEEIQAIILKLHWLGGNISLAIPVDRDIFDVGLEEVVIVIRTSENKWTLEANLPSFLDCWVNSQSFLSPREPLPSMLLDRTNERPKVSLHWQTGSDESSEQWRPSLFWHPPISSNENSILSDPVCGRLAWRYKQVLEVSQIKNEGER